MGWTTLTARRPTSELPADPLAPIARVHRIRRLCALALGVIGFFDLVTAILPPARPHLTLLFQFAPLVVAQGAAALLALCGLVLLVLVRGLRRGQWTPKRRDGRPQMGFVPRGRNGVSDNDFR